MSTGSFVMFDRAKLKIVNGTVNIGSQNIRAALCTQTFTPTAAFAGTSTDARYSDITGEVANGNGYTTGGNLLTGVTLTRSGGTVTFNANSVSWASSTITAKWVVLYVDGATNKDLLGYMDLWTLQAAGLSSTNGTFTVNWNASGIFTIT